MSYPTTVQMMSAQALLLTPLAFAAGPETFHGVVLLVLLEVGKWHCHAGTAAAVG